VAQTIKELKPDAFIVYDIQDEKSRNGEERPFPFFKTHETRTYAKALEDLTGVEPIVYQAITEEMTAGKMETFLSESREKYGTKNLVFVGGSSSETPLLTVCEAAYLTTQHYYDFMLGGITIPERHRDKLDEHCRLYQKWEHGITFFTSQVVYNADNAIWMLRDYDEFCKARSRTPARIIFAFAPFGRESTVQFLQWLGVEIPHGTVKRVLSRGTPQSCVRESNQICWENFKRILDASKRMGLSVPLGVTVESVSKYKDETLGANELFAALRDELNAYYSNSRN
jgi:5,10-methylenetetrahydrofolate reductase